MLIAMGSASELEYHLLLARDLGYLDNREYQELWQGTQEVKRVLSTLITKLRHTKNCPAEMLTSEAARPSVLTSHRRRRAEKR